jgi:transcriptional regulator with XRE-family HTH domain
LDSWDLKKWRKKHGFNQFEAAEKLGTNRSGLQDWEREVRPIWRSIELACEEITRLERRRPDFGPVTLVCTDGPILRVCDDPYHVKLLCFEQHPNNAAAIRAVIRSGLNLSHGDILILAEDGFVIWQSEELIGECHRQKETSAF